MDSEDQELAGGGEAAMKRGLSDGIVIANRIIVVCLSLVLPILLGWWLSGRWGRPMLGLILGLAFGMFAAGFQLLSLVKWLNKRSQSLRVVAKEQVRRVERAGDSSVASDARVEEDDPWETRWREKWEGEVDES